MINYTPQNQLSLELFRHPFEQSLDTENRWVKLAEVIPWDELAAVYSSKLQRDTGRKSVDVRIVIAALIVKHKLRLDDRGTVAMIQENIYLQYFCGLREFRIKPVFDPSLFVDIRKRLGLREFDRFNQLVIDKSEELKPHQSRVKKKKKDEDDFTGGNITKSNKGTLKVDASIADQEITYPTDLKLLNEARENLERIIDKLYNPKSGKAKPRTYRRKARKQFLDMAKKKRKSVKALRWAVKGQLQYVRRDLSIIDGLLKSGSPIKPLEERDRKILEVIRILYEQQKWMYDNNTHTCKARIVSIYQPHVRPMVRGKDKSKTEFGSKINISEVNGFCRVDQFSWDAFNEGTYLIDQVEGYRDLYNCYPKMVLADQIYLNRENRKYLKEKGIEMVGKPLGRPPLEKQTAQQKYHKKKKAAKRNSVEGRFGVGKRGYGLNNIKARLAETSESWVNAIIFTMNLFKLLEVAEKYPKLFFLWLRSSKIHRRGQLFISIWIRELFYSKIRSAGGI